MANKGIIDRLAELPKGLVLSVSVLVIAVIGFVLVYFGFGMNKKPVPEQNGPVIIDMPEASSKDYDKSRLETYQEMDYNRNYDNMRDSYWDSLGDDLVSTKSDKPSNDVLDPSVYTPVEIYQIQHGMKTKEEIDREHAAKAAQAAAAAQSGYGYGAGSYAQGGQPQMTAAQKDSAYFARMEKAYQIAAKYTPQTMGGEMPPPGGTAQAEPAEPEAPKERTIDLAAPSSSLPADSFDGDGIITSLMEPDRPDGVNQVGTTNSRPVKATFLKNESLSDGQRVIIRLMQDLTLSNGTVIPANTHITGICHFSSRLKIDVKMLHYNGRMFATDISVYDNDGTEGIYCPSAESGKKKRKAAKDIASGAVSAVGGVAGTLLGSGVGGAMLGRMASSGIQSITSSINSDGSVSVKVTSGYEFYVFENVEKDGYR